MSRLRRKGTHTITKEQMPYVEVNSRHNTVRKHLRDIRIYNVTLAGEYTR